MSKIFVEDKHLQTLRDLFATQGVLAYAFVFGSRARGDHRSGSDLDILIRREKALTMSELAKLNTALSDSDLPFKVDIVDWNMISEAFQSKIKDQLIPL